MAEKSIPDVSMNNTKKEILEAYDQLLAQYRAKKEQALDSQEKIQEIKDRKAVKVAEELSQEKVLNQISEVRASIGSFLGQVSDRLESAVARFESVRRAIEVKEAELKEVYDIEREAGSLATLIDLQKQKREELESGLAERKRQLEDDIQRTRSEWEKEKERRATEATERSVEEKRQRQRQKEEFEYEFEREKRRARDQFEEEQEKLGKELRLKREELDRREESLATREQELNELRQRVDLFQSELDTATARAVDETSKRLKAEAQAQTNLMNKEFDGERNVLLTRIDSLEKVIKEQAQQLQRLSQTQEKAYQQVQDIAVKAVEGAGAHRAVSQSAGQAEAKKSDKDQ